VTRATAYVRAQNYRTAHTFCRLVFVLARSSPVPTQVTLRPVIESGFGAVYTSLTNGEDICPRIDRSRCSLSEGSASSQDEGRPNRHPDEKEWQGETGSKDECKRTGREPERGTPTAALPQPHPRDHIEGAHSDQ
jgi:hypothetical protein